MSRPNKLKDKIAKAAVTGLFMIGGIFVPYTIQAKPIINKIEQSQTNTSDIRINVDAASDENKEVAVEFQYTDANNQPVVDAKTNTPYATIISKDNKGKDIKIVVYEKDNPNVKIEQVGRIQGADTYQDVDPAKPDLRIVKYSNTKNPTGRIFLRNNKSLGNTGAWDNTAEEAAKIIAGKGDITDRLWAITDLSTGITTEYKFKNGKLVNKETEEPIQLGLNKSYQIESSIMLVDPYADSTIVKLKSAQKHGLGKYLNKNTAVEGQKLSLDEVVEQSGAEYGHLIINGRNTQEDKYTITLTIKPKKKYGNIFGANETEVGNTVDIQQKYVVKYDVTEYKDQIYDILKKIKEDDASGKANLTITAGTALPTTESQTINNGIPVKIDNQQQVPFNLEGKLVVGLPLDLKLLADGKYALNIIQKKNNTLGTGDLIGKETKHNLLGDVSVLYAPKNVFGVQLNEILGIGAGFSKEKEIVSVTDAALPIKTESNLDGYNVIVKADLSKIMSNIPIGIDVKYRNVSGEKKTEGTRYSDGISRQYVEIDLKTGALRLLDVPVVKDIDVYGKWTNINEVQKNAPNPISTKIYEAGVIYNTPVQGLDVVLGYEGKNKNNSQNHTGIAKIQYKFGN